MYNQATFPSEVCHAVQTASRTRRFFSIACVLGLAALAFGAATVNQLNNRGIEAMQRSAFPEAVDAFQQAQRLLPTDETLRANERMARNAWGIALGAEGKFEQGERELATALAGDPANEMVGTNLAILRTNWAMTLMQEGRFDAAEKMFYKAYSSAPEKEFSEIDARRSQNMTLEAQAQRKAGRDETARARLQSALEVDPDNVAALLDAAEMDYEAGDTNGALEKWLRAQALKPDIENLAPHIEKVKRESQTEQNFQTRSSSHFTVAFEGEAARAVAANALRILDTAYAQVGAELKFHPQRKLNVVLYTPEQYKTVTAAPHWTGALYDGKIRVPIPNKALDQQELDQLTHSLRHEFVHAIVHQVGGADIPSWFNEGVAMYFEGDAQQRRAQFADFARLALDDADRFGAISIMQLPEQFTDIADETAARRAYTLSRTFVLWLGLEQRPYRFKEVLELAKSGKTLDEAIAQVYGQPLDQLEQAFYDALTSRR